jgi:hypothetical protein
MDLNGKGIHLIYLKVVNKTYKNQMAQSRAEGHSNRLREEILAHIEEYFADRDQSIPTGMEDYVRTQTRHILERMYTDEDAESRPEDVNPDKVEGDYYREYIAEYGTIYSDYSIDDEDKEDGEDGEDGDNEDKEDRDKEDVGVNEDDVEDEDEDE